MNFFKRYYVIRRYLEPQNVRGYINIPYGDKKFLMDVQTTENASVTTEDGTKSIQKLKVFCDFELLAEDVEKQQKADRLWFNGKWFDCKSCRLSENTPLRHYTATFVELLDQEKGPNETSDETSDEQKPSESEGDIVES